ncbi:MAG: TM2 domain-containing protein [Muribaculaceae bacterium]
MDYYQDNRYGPYGNYRQDPPPYNQYGNNGNNHVPPQWYNNDPFASGPSGKSRGVTALLAILLGCLGIQYFYLNKSTGGLVFLLISVLSCGTLAWIISILSVVQGILLFCMTNEEFERKFAGPMSPTFPLF